jgi:hypothetical protein
MKAFLPSGQECRTRQTVKGVSNQGWDLRARHKGQGSVGGKGRWGSEGDGWGRGLVGSMCQL